MVQATSPRDEGSGATFGDAIGASLERLGEARYIGRQIGAGTFLSVFLRAFHFLLDPSLRGPGKIEASTLDRRYHALLERDLENARLGRYPRELLFDFPTTHYLKLLPAGLTEIPRILWRRLRRGIHDLPEIEHRENYPEYYLRNFHWQSDGWFSSRSARLYDLSVETLFVGTADVMRRMALAPLTLAVSGLERPRILDVACGTGRFLLQVHRAIPAAKLCGIDLSPHYLKEAQRVLEAVQGLSLIEDNAESMPLQDGSFDAVTSVFLFHELPKDVRRRVMKEVLRVLRPGGTFVVSDSAQLSESSEIEYFLSGFPQLYHEPYFKGYLSDDLGIALAELGFEVLSTEPHFVSKVVVAKKP
jgi:ubiquinone/menaquinone biosynthesis C-methylase UbiE